MNLIHRGDETPHAHKASNGSLVTTFLMGETDTQQNIITRFFH